MKKILEKIANQKPKNILLIGTGGGSDIYSSLFVALSLAEKMPNISIDVAGMLSPAAIHYYYDSYPLNGIKEKTINKITNNQNHRYLQNKQMTAINFVDNLLPYVISKCKSLYHLPVENMYHFSTLYGTKNLIKDVNKLIRKNRYDMVIGVDVGGDILAEGCQRNLLSPMMDMTCLTLLANIKTECYLIEMGYGTDGEANGNRFEDTVWVNPLIQDKVNVNGFPFQGLKDIYSWISTIRKGNTIPFFIESCESNEKIITKEHTYTYKLNEYRFIDRFNVTLEAPFDDIYLIDPKNVANANNECVIDYDHPIQQAIHFKIMAPSWASEIDFQCIAVGDEVVLFGFLSDKFNERARREALEIAIENIGESYDGVLIHKYDIAEVCPLETDSVFCVSEDTFLIYRNSLSKLPIYLKNLLAN